MLLLGQERFWLIEQLENLELLDKPAVGRLPFEGLRANNPPRANKKNRHWSGAGQRTTET
jgi:hypothetical protein